VVTSRKFVPDYVVFHGENNMNLGRVDKAANIVILLVMFGGGGAACKILEADAEGVGWFELLEVVAPWSEIRVQGLEWGKRGQRLHVRQVAAGGGFCWWHLKVKEVKVLGWCIVVSGDAGESRMPRVTRTG